MRTIKDELKQIANVCLTSKEFTDKAKAYLRGNKGISQPIMSDAELRDIYRETSFMREKKKAWEKYNNAILPALKKRPDCANIYYEAWIDLSQDWIDKWMHSFRFMSDNEILDVCAQYLNEQERFYGSDDYIDMLNNQLKSANFT